ncbi:MAG: hypothetical protein ACYDER_14095 [Ktedonobacteraceae bacterium]|jgi:hypothetical protein
MSNFGTMLVRLTALAGGAVIGVVLSKMYDEALTKRADERSVRDKTRYAQGLAAMQDEPRA